jgi:hypothetical protein
MYKYKFSSILKAGLFVLSCFAYNVSFAQSEAATMNQDVIYGNSGFIHTINPKSKVILGSPYINSDWQDAMLTTEKNQVFKNLKLKYDVYQNEILLLKPNGDSVALLPNIVREFIVTNTESKEKQYKRFNNLNTNDVNLKLRFMNVLHENKVILAKLTVAQILAADKVQGTYGSQRLNDEYGQNESYYFIDKDNIPTKTKINKKNLFKVLADKEDKIKLYIDKERIDTNSEEGWVKTLIYYDTL